jgi:hypothetical protein
MVPGRRPNGQRRWLGAPTINSATERSAKATKQSGEKPGTLNPFCTLVKKEAADGESPQATAAAYLT